MEKRMEEFEIASGLSVGGGRMLVVAGPCVVESHEVCLETALRLREITQKLDVGYVFKASFDKANRTSSRSFRSLGFAEALEILQAVGKAASAPVLTDIHETWQVKPAAEAAAILQIPAFLCRQTDLLVEAGKSGRVVNIKRGQFMAPDDMAYAVEKVSVGGNSRVMLTERGVSFGYHNLVVDMRCPAGDAAVRAGALRCDAQRADAGRAGGLIRRAAAVCAVPGAGGGGGGRGWLLHRNASRPGAGAERWTQHDPAEGDGRFSV